MILTTAVGSEHLREVFAWNYEEAERGDDLALHDGTALKLIEVEAEIDETGDADVEEGALPTGDTDDEDDSLDHKLSVPRSLVTRRQLQHLVDLERHRLRVRRRWRGLLE